MKTRLSTLIFLTAILLVVSCHYKSTNIESETNNKIENLEVFAKLYGYVRYFHPSDEADSINWNKFLYYGIEQVSAVLNETELKQVLENLFLPIAPTMDIYSTKDKPEPLTPNIKTDDKVLVTWQHRGIGISANSNYKSIRLGRTDIADLNSNIGTELPIRDYSNKKYKLFIKGEADENSLAKVEIFSITSSYSETVYSKIIKSDDWNKVILKGEFPDDTKNIYVSIGLIGEGSIKVDDLELLLFNGEGNSETLLTTHNNWKSEENGSGIYDWYIYGFGYTYEIEKENNIAYLRIQSRGEIIPGSLFEKHANTDDMILRNLGKGISCRIPIALYLSKEKPSQFSAEFDSLNIRLEEIHIEDTTAQLEPTRIGAVISAWNIFNHFYPYFDVVETDWDNVLTETLINILQDQNEKDCLFTLLGMTSQLHDGHASVRHPVNKNFKRLPVLFDFIDDQVIVISSNNKQLQKGDILIEIDGKSANQTFNDIMKIMSGSPQWKKVGALWNFTAQDSNEVSELKIKRQDEILNISVDRKGKVPEMYRPENISKINNDIIYINLDKASMEEIDEKIGEIAKSKGVIFDLRGYPNGNHDVISYMIDFPVQSARWNVPQIIYPDLENIVGYDTTGRWTLKPKQPRIQGEIVFLTDGGAISYAESFMGIIEHYKLAEIVGSTTAGANGNINPFTTMGGFRISWTGMKVLKQDYSQHHLIGIKPTISIRPTLKGISEGHDEVLEKAVEILSK